MILKLQGVAHGIVRAKRDVAPWTLWLCEDRTGPAAVWNVVAQCPIPAVPKAIKRLVFGFSASRSEDAKDVFDKATAADLDRVTIKELV